MEAVAMTLPQGPELLLILAVVVLLFGAKKLPELGGSIGRSITNLKQGMAEAQADVDEATELDALTADGTDPSAASTDAHASKA